MATHDLLSYRGTRPAGRSRWVAPVLVGWALGYGALRAYWSATELPDFTPMGYDLVLHGWESVALCVAAALLGVVQRITRGSRTAVLAGWVVTGGLVVSSAILLLDAVGVLLATLGILVDAGAAASRLACFGVAVLLAISTRDYQRDARGACPSCGRGPGHRPLAGTPGWAFWGGHLAVAGCLIRLVAQYTLIDASPFRPGVAAVIFEVGFLMAGILLPLALVHRFGRIWPFWVPGLSGRRVPRWLVLGPGLVLSTGLVAYFGAGLAQTAVDTAMGHPVENAAFLWVAMSAYWLWGLGMGAAALSYFRLTRPACRQCLRSR